MFENTVYRRVEWGETDAAGIVFYPNIYRWFDAAAHDLLSASGLPVKAMLTAGEIFPLVETHARYRRPILVGDEIQVTTRVSEVRTRSFKLEHVVTRSAEIVAEGYEVRVWARVVPRGIEAVPIPEADRQNLLSTAPPNRTDDAPATRR